MPKRRKIEDLRDAVLRAAYAENPSGLTASGWYVDDSGKVSVGDESLPANRQLAKVLAGIGMMPLTDLATGAALDAAGTALMSVPKVRNAVLSYNVARELGRGARKYSKVASGKIDDAVLAGGGVYAEQPYFRTLSVSSSDASPTRVGGYSGYTPTDQSKARSFVDDVAEALDWEARRGPLSEAKSDYIDFSGKYYIDGGREADVYPFPGNGDKVLKVVHHRAVPGDKIYPAPYMATPEEAVAWGEEFVRDKNLRPYNLAQNVEGVTEYVEGRGYLPVISQKRVIPADKAVHKSEVEILDDMKSLGERIGNPDGVKEIVSIGTRYERPAGMKQVNNIIYENDFQKIMTDPYDGKMYLETKDLRKDNIGYLWDGSLVGIDLFGAGGPIRIKPENRGKFTALKERTGHSASWFKENGTPAQKKMAVFALNARKWNHKDDGGDIDRGRLDSIVNAVNERSDADFVKRLLDTKRGFIRNYDGSVSSHELGYVTSGDDAIVFPEIQNIDSNLVRLPYPQSLESAIERGDTLQMSVPDAEMYTANYKEAYPGFEQYSQYGQGFLYPSPSTESGSSVVVDTVDVPVEGAVPEYDYDEIKRRQYYIESKFNNKAKSPAGARGAYQIMPITLKDYTMRTGETGDLDDYAFNEKVRDFYMNRYLNSEWATKENQSEYNRIAKALAAYNWGVGNLTKYLNKKKEDGVDIYGGTEWISGLPAETKNYIKWILDKEDIGSKTTNEKYEKAKKKRFSYGGALRRALDAGESELIRAAIEKMRAGR